MVEVATVPPGRDGPLDPHRLAEAFSAVVDAVDVLRTRIVTDQGEARVVVGPTDDSALTTHVQLDRDRLEQWVAERSSVPIDMAVRAYDSVILSHSDGSVSWYLGLHHTVTDATSSTLIFRRTAAVYDGDDAVGSSYYRWAEQRAELADRRVERAASYWQSRPAAPSIGSLYAGDVPATAVSHRLAIPVEPDLLEGLDSRLQSDLRMLSADLGWSTLLLTATAVLIHRVNGATSFAVGLPVHHRNEQGVRDVIGPVMQVYPVDVEVAADDSFRSLHARIGRSVLATLRHTGPAGPPVAGDYQAVVNLLPEMEQPSFAGSSADVQWVHAGAADPGHLLRMQFTRFGPRPQLFLDVNEAAATPAQHPRVVSHLLALLHVLAADPDLGIGAFTLPGQDELEALEQWGTGPALTPVADQRLGPTTVVDRLRAGLAQSNRPAISASDGSESLTGHQLWERVEGLAGTLREHGVGPGVRVGIAKQRSVDAVVALFATLTAGGSFVSLDPAHPLERRQRLVERAGCLLVLDDAAGLSVVGNGPAPAASDEAYLLFTSGSTGEPKGVPISHRGLSDYLDFAMASYVQPGVPPVGALVSALTFDLTITSLFVPLLAGGELVVVGADGPAGLRAVADHDRISWLKITPSHLEILCRFLANRPETHPLRTLVVGGEAFGAALAHAISELVPHVDIFNEYGPTEAVVGCMIHHWSAADHGADVAIGRPTPGVELRVLDQHGHRVPIGATGHLHIAHRGLTAGYLGGEGDDAFVELDGTRFYRSGDLARHIDDQTLVYQGRADEQLKVGGIRLDPTEVEQALLEHPLVDRAVVRMWEPARRSPSQHCVLCGLPDNVPGTQFDDDGVCEQCHSYDSIKGQAEAWFRTTDDLVTLRDRARATRTGNYDAVHLLSGGKDSTYALYQLVDLGFDVLCLTLDNGFVSTGALDNVRRSVADLGIDYEIMTSDVMNDVFRDSMDRHSNVCHGCYKTIYTLATERAAAEGAPLIFTGLSRGQLFETRLIPEQFTEGRFDPQAIDDATLQARRVYHRLDDGPNRLLDTSVFEVGDDGTDIFDRISYVDFYRYVDVELAEMFDFLENRAPWVRPSDTGRSTNCLVNAAGIHTHLTEQGFHNYAEPYAWDVRLGHKTRTEAMEELDDQLDLVEVGEMLETIGYQPQPRQTLTAWFEAAEDVDANRLRTFLAERLPVHAIPRAFVAVPEVPLSTNGKVDAARLPAPERVHRAGPSLYVSAQTATESAVVSEWEAQLGIEPIGVDDDFFALGGDSLAALKMVVGLSLRLEQTVREELAFTAPTPRTLAAAIDASGPFVGSTAGPQPRSEGPPTLSLWERAILFEHFAEPEVPRYNTARQYTVDGAVEATKFVDAAQRVVGRHVPLHWTFGEPRQQLSVEQALEVTVHSPVASVEDFEAASARLQQQPFDVEAGPLGRLLIQPLSDGTTGITLVFHHLSVDAGTLDELWNQIERAYVGLPFDEKPVDYADIGDWQRQRLEQGASTGAADFWTSPEMTREVASFSYPTDSTTSPDGYLSRPTAFGLDELRAAATTTPFALALAALATTLRPYADGDSLGISVAASTRDHPLAADLVGYYLNTLPLVVETQPGRTMRQLAASTSALLSEALPHRGYPLGSITDDRRRQGLPEPDVRVLLAYQELAPATLGSLAARHQVPASGSAVTDASFFVQGRGRHVVLGLEYDGRVLNSAAANELLDRFEQALQDMISSPDAVLEVVDHEMAERLQALAHGPSVPPSAFVAAQQPFETAAAEKPNAPAVVQGGRSLSYADVERRANIVAHSLIAGGTKPGDFVGVVAQRSPDTVVAILGVLKSGAGYVPIDPAYPRERREQIAEDADLRTFVDGSVLSDGPDPGPPSVTADPDRPAYAIFTSGSTGRPKGVSISHRNIIESTTARQQVYESGPEQFLLLSSFAFDSSMVGLFWTLFHGGSIVLPEEGRHTDTAHLASLVQQQTVTHLLALPSLYRVLLEEGRGPLVSLATVIVAGEVCPPALVHEHYESLPGAELWNEYGPTEATVWSHAFRVPVPATGEPSTNRVPIGRPIPNAGGQVVDRDLRPVALGQPGELVLGGPGISSGYLGRPELTEKAFVALPGGDGSLHYRTGDQVRWAADGNLEFLGRIDQQVKIRGHRVELGEVESAVLATGQIGAVVVDAIDGPGGTKQLAMWLVLQGDGPDHEEVVNQLHQRLSRRLPDVMVPRHVQVLDQLPVTANGKVDRAALPDPRLTRSEPAGRLESELEQAMALVWTDVLGLESVDRLDNFFDLGGDSIMSIQIVSRLRRRGWEVSTREVFDYPTIAALATIARPAGAATAEQGLLAGSTPLLPIQHWFLAQQVPNIHNFSQSRWLTLDPDVDLDLLLAAARHLPAQHDMLRARLDRSEHLFRFVDDDEGSIDAQVEFGSSSAANGPEVLNIEDGPVMVVRARPAADGQPPQVFVAVHHMVMDAVSWSPLLEDWAEAYQQMCTQDRPVFMPKSTSVRQWCSQLEQWATGNRVEQPAERLAAPDHGQFPDGETRRSTVRYEADLTGKLVANGTIEQTLLVAVAQGVEAGLGTTEVTITVEGHGRQEDIAEGIDLSRTVGWFTTHHDRTIQIETEAATTLRTLISEAPGHRGLAEGMARWTNRPHQPAAQIPILFNYLGRATDVPSEVFETLGPVHLETDPNNPRLHTLGIEASIVDGRLAITWDHHPVQIAPELVAVMQEGCSATLVSLATNTPAQPAAADDTAASFDLVDLDNDELASLGDLLDGLDG